MLDAMSFSKLNVLHWHIVDAESFPVQSISWPLLSEGAWRSDLIYSQQDIQLVVREALYRGIRVIPEFDTPGHTASWGIGYPELVATCPDYSSNVNNIPLDPTNEFTYMVVDGLFSEISKLFIEEYFHIGGDEVVYNCWKEDSNITNWMQRNGIQTFDQLMALYLNKLFAAMKSNKKGIIAWQEVFSSYGLNVPSDVIIEVWKDEATLIQVAKSKHRGLLAYGWYLDHLDKTWKDFYNNEPFASSEWNSVTEKMILGGEASAWGEQINQFNIEQAVHTRTCATAERLWSDKSVNDVITAQPRLIDHICRLNRRSVSASPIRPGYCDK